MSRDDVQQGVGPHDDRRAARSRTILVAVDDGPPSTWAVSAAVELARALGASIELLNVVVPPPVGASELGPMPDELDVLETRAAETLRCAAESLPSGMCAGAVIREGSPPREILARAREVGACLIVLGTRGRGRLTHFLLGSTAETVIRSAPCPVVTVASEQAIRSLSGSGEVAEATYPAPT